MNKNKSLSCAFAISSLAFCIGIESPLTSSVDRLDPIGMLIQGAKDTIRNRHSSDSDFQNCESTIKDQLMYQGKIAKGVHVAGSNSVSEEERNRAKKAFFQLYDVLESLIAENKKRFGTDEFRNRGGELGLDDIESDRKVFLALENPNRVAQNYWVRPRIEMLSIGSGRIPLYRGDKVSIVDIEGDWANVTTEAGQVGKITVVSLSTFPVTIADLIPPEYRSGSFSFKGVMKDSLNQDAGEITVRFHVKDGILQSAEFNVKNLSTMQNLKDFYVYAPSFHIFDASGYHRNNIIMIGWYDDWLNKNGGVSHFYVPIGEEKSFSLEPYLMMDLTHGERSESPQTVWLDFITSPKAWITLGNYGENMFNVRNYGDVTKEDFKKEN